MITLDRDNEGIFTLVMNAGENRWNTTFVKAFSDALDEVEDSTGAAALITRSANEKFFSNGLDLEWVQDPQGHPEGGDLESFGAGFMALMGRIITLPVPSVCAVNGHAFGAGFMAALCHDIRIMRKDRGFLCANEMQLGLSIPSEELSLFRHKLPASVFYETVQLARRWTGVEALKAGIVQYAVEYDDVPLLAAKLAEEYAPLGANRQLFGGQKERLFGENAVLNGPHGAAHLLKNPSRVKEKQDAGY